MSEVVEEIVAGCRRARAIDDDRQSTETWTVEECTDDLTCLVIAITEFLRTQCITVSSISPKPEAMSKTQLTFEQALQA